MTATDGPFTEAKMVGHAQFELNSKEEAIEGAVRFELHKEHWPGWEGETGTARCSTRRFRLQQ